MHGELSMVAPGRPISWEWIELHGGCTFDHRETQKHPLTLPGVTTSPLRPGFIISQGQGSQHRRQSHSARRQADGPSLASWPSAFLGGGGLKARPHHWLVQREGLQPRRAEPGARTDDTGDPSLSSKDTGP